MKVIRLFFLLLIYSVVVTAQNNIAEVMPVGMFKNNWTKPPAHIPNDVSIDAPLMGNGDVTMNVGYKDNFLRYYVGKNDFWRLRSQADNLSYIVRKRRSSSGVVMSRDLPWTPVPLRVLRLLAGFLSIALEGLPGDQTRQCTAVSRNREAHIRR